MIAQLAVEYGLPPGDLERCSTEMLDTIVAYVKWASDERKRAADKASRTERR